MAYTLVMPADQRIKFAKDGVAEVPMTDARAALTSLIREVSWGGTPGAFTERGKRVAMVVPTDQYDETLVMRELRGYLRELEVGNKPDIRLKAQMLREALDVAKRRALDSS